MTLNALYPVLVTDRVAESHRFYRDLLDLETAFESEWFVHLASPAPCRTQIGLLVRGHDSLPERFASQETAGVLITVEVDDVDALHSHAAGMGVPIELSLRDEVWGQRHFIVRDPNGIAVDLVQVIPVSAPEIAAQYDPGALPSGSTTHD